MKIAFLLDRFPLNGGVERVTIDLANSFIAHGLEIFIISKIGDKPELLAQLSNNVKVIQIEDSYFCKTNIDSIIKTNKIDILINQGAYPHMNKMIATLNKSPNIKILSVLHNEPNHILKWAYHSIGCGKYGRIKKIIKPIYLRYIKNSIKQNYNSLLNFSDRVVLLSPSYKSELSSWIKPQKREIALSKITSIYNPINKCNYDKLDAKENVILFVGRLDENQKKISRLINIWKKVYADFPEWRFEIYGDGTDYNKYVKFVESNNIGNLFFKGFIKDMSLAYSNAKILLLTSDFEGLPMVILEAMNYGCVPLIYNSFSAASDIINNYVNGILIPYNREDIFIDNLKSIINNPAKYDEMSVEAKQTSSNFSIEKITQNWIELFNQI